MERPMGPSEPGGGESGHLSIAELDISWIGGKLLPKGRLLKLDFQFNKTKKEKKEREILSTAFL
jgi:hypothetical protein